MKKDINDIAKEVANQIKYLEYKVEHMKVKLSDNLVEHLSLISENLYIYQYQIAEFKYQLLFLNSPHHTDKSEQEKLKMIVREYEQFLKHKGNVRSYSSNAIEREISTWIYIAKLDLKNWFSNRIEGDFKIYEWDTCPTTSLNFFLGEPETNDEDVERNEFGDEFVGGCATCGDDINSAQTDSNGNCKNCR